MTSASRWSLRVPAAADRHREPARRRAGSRNDLGTATHRRYATAGGHGRHDRVSSVPSPPGSIYILGRALEAITAFLVVAEMVILFIGIVARYVFHSPADLVR